MGRKLAQGKAIMKRILLGTTALAFAGAMGAGQASAADMLSVGVGGYMEQWGWPDRPQQLCRRLGGRRRQPVVGQ